MSEHLDRVKGYLLDLGFTIVAENEADELVVVDDEDNGIKQLVIDCEPPIVVLEQLIAEVPAEPGNLFVRLQHPGARRLCVGRNRRAYFLSRHLAALESRFE